MRYTVRLYIWFVAVACTATQPVEHFNVRDVADDVTRLRAALSGMSDGDYLMGASVDDVGADFHLLHVSRSIQCKECSIFMKKSYLAVYYITNQILQQARVAKLTH